MISVHAAPRTTTRPDPAPARRGMARLSPHHPFGFRWSDRHRALARVPRVVRFGLVGGFGSAIELALLAALVTLGVDKGLANAAALIALAQLHFFASREITWAERRVPAEGTRAVLGKLVRFDGMMATSLLANQLTFELTAPHVPLLLAGALGILAASLINYTVSDRLIFAES